MTLFLIIPTITSTILLTTGHVDVITFGGSYSGALSAWFRTKYPNLAIAAVASSAPVEALLDFYQYQDVVTASLGTSTYVCEYA